jgi:hypothetical protein
MKIVDLRIPKIAPPYEEWELLAEAVWQPYPLSSPGEISFPLVIEVQRYGLNNIVANLIPFVLSGNPDDSPLPGHVIMDQAAKLDGLNHLEQQLLNWYQDLPAQLRFHETKPSSAAEPLVDL